MNGRMTDFIFLAAVLGISGIGFVWNCYKSKLNPDYPLKTDGKFIYGLLSASAMFLYYMGGQI